MFNQINLFFMEYYYVMVNFYVIIILFLIYVLIYNDLHNNVVLLIKLMYVRLVV
jgi:hypothetical protein